MKKLSVFSMAILAVALFSLPAFAVNQIERESSSSDFSASGDVLQNPILSNAEGSGAFPVLDNREAYNRGEMLQSPMLTNAEGSGAFPMRIHSSDENYGIAPTWGERDGGSKGMATETYRAYQLPGVFENYN
jgi:hypothetical protein